MNNDTAQAIVLIITSILVPISSMFMAYLTFKVNSMHKTQEQTKSRVIDTEKAINGFLHEQRARDKIANVAEGKLEGIALGAEKAETLEIGRAAGVAAEKERHIEVRYTDD